MTATDQDSAVADLVWSKAGGADAGQFTLSTAGDLAFAAAPDYENPDDADGDNVYEITVQVSDGDNTDTADLSVTLENVLELLTELTGPSSTDYAENGAVRVATYTASSEADRDGIAWQLGGDDAEYFSIDNPLGVLRFHIDPVDPSLFLQPPDFEAPVDDDDDNVYEVIVLAQAGSALTLKSVFVTVTDENEAGTLTLSSSRPPSWHRANRDAERPGHRQRHGRVEVGALGGPQRLDRHRWGRVEHLHAGGRRRGKLPAGDGVLHRPPPQWQGGPGRGAQRCLGAYAEPS